MPQWAIILLGILIPFAGTVLGAGMVFFLKKEMNPSVQKFLLGFAAGVMTAASVWSLLLPAFELSEGGSVPSYIPTAGGFLLGIGFLLLLDKLVPHQHLDHVQPEGLKAHLGKNTMLMLAVTIHNIPEGMVVGAAFAGMLNGNAVITLSSTLVLAAGIALQNFPEGTIISMPLRGNGFSKGKAFLFGALSGAVEPIAAAVTLFTVGMITPIFPYLLSFAAGRDDLRRGGGTDPRGAGWRTAHQLGNDRGGDRLCPHDGFRRGFRIIFRFFGARLGISRVFFHILLGINRKE